MRLAAPIAFIVAALGGCAGSSSPPPVTASKQSQRDSLLALQAADLRVASVAYKLAVEGAAICPVKAPLSGLTLHDAAQYAPALRSDAQLAFAFGDRVALLAVAPESPGDRAGLQAGDRLVAIGARTLDVARGRKNSSFDSVASAYALLESAAAAGSVALEVERGSARLRKTVTPVRGCASRVQLLPSAKIEARASGTILSVTTALLEFVNDDDELALVLAHEMAHNALGHRQLLRAQSVGRGFLGGGQSNAAIRSTEQAADRLAYFLMARAGYQVGAAPGFWTRLYDGPARSWAKSPAHPNSKARIDEARRTASEIAHKRLSALPLVP